MQSSISLKIGLQEIVALFLFPLKSALVLYSGQAISVSLLCFSISSPKHFVAFYLTTFGESYCLDEFLFVTTISA